MDVVVIIVFMLILIIIVVLVFFNDVQYKGIFIPYEFYKIRTIYLKI